MFGSTQPWQSITQYQENTSFTGLVNGCFLWSLIIFVTCCRSSMVDNFESDCTLLYNDMLWVVMNMLCFVSFLLMVCWNLHMPGVEIYTSSVNVVLMVCWNLCIPAYGKNWNLHIAWLFSLNLVWIWTQNLGCHCIIVIKHGLLCFVTGLRQCMPTHALTFTKHRQPMFNYYNKCIWIYTLYLRVYIELYQYLLPISGCNLSYSMYVIHVHVVCFYK